ncbi:MAG TPA: hypothetical protein VF403_08145 [Kofleriaceae bacterium]
MRWLVLLLIARTAYADPTDFVARPLVLDEHQISAQLVIENNLAPSGGFAKPLSFAPDLWIGVTPRLTLGIIHSDPSVDRISPGASVCVRRDDFICIEVYRGGGIDALYAIDVPGQFSFAPHARLLVRDLDPVKPALTLGASARWQHGRLAVSADPFLQLGLGNNARGNRAELWIPIVLAVQPTCRWVFELHTGWDSDVAIINEDGWHVPVGFAVRAAATTHLDLGGEFGFTSLLGPQNNPKQRVAFVTIGWRS